MDAGIIVTVSCCDNSFCAQSQDVSLLLSGAWQVRRLRERLIEGYQSPVFSVAFVGSHRHITIYCTDNPEEAREVHDEISDFLENNGVSTQVHE